MLTVHVQSTDELLSIALKAEQEAVRRYTELARAMRAEGNDETAALFDRMVDEEKQHEQLILEWARVEGRKLNENIGPIRWEDPQVATDYDLEARDPLRSTPYRALALAVHNEERAFRFYTHVAANAGDDSLREYAEILAREELGHAALMRSMRRRAWHAERNRQREEPAVEPAAIESLADLISMSLHMEGCIIANLNALLDDHPELQQVVRPGEETMRALEDLPEASAATGAATRQAIDSIAVYRQRLDALSGDREQLLRRLCTDADRCFAFYDAVVTQAREEAVMLLAQRLSTLALQRIDLLRDILGSSCTTNPKDST